MLYSNIILKTRDYFLKQNLSLEKGRRRTDFCWIASNNRYFSSLISFNHHEHREFKLTGLILQMRKMRPWEDKQGHVASTREMACDPLFNLPDYFWWYASKLTSHSFQKWNNIVAMYRVSLYDAPATWRVCLGLFVFSFIVVQAKQLPCSPPILAEAA